MKELLDLLSGLSFMIRLGEGTIYIECQRDVLKAFQAHIGGELQYLGRDSHDRIIYIVFGILVRMSIIDWNTEHAPFVSEARIEEIFKSMNE